MIHLANLGFLEITALLGITGAITAGIAALRKLGPEKDALYITSSQGAAMIMDNLIKALNVEIDRGRARIAWLEAEVERLEAENERLRYPTGTRVDDP